MNASFHPDITKSSSCLFKLSELEEYVILTDGDQMSYVESIRHLPSEDNPLALENFTQIILHRGLHIVAQRFQLLSSRGGRTEFLKSRFDSVTLSISNTRSQLTICSRRRDEKSEFRSNFNFVAFPVSW